MLSGGRRHLIGTQQERMGAVRLAPSRKYHRRAHELASGKVKHLAAVPAGIAEHAYARRESRRVLAGLERGKLPIEGDRVGSRFRIGCRGIFALKGEGA